MNVTVQDRISPGAPPSARSYSQEDVKSTNKDPIADDFGNVLAAASAEAKVEREAKKNGDLTSKTDEEFFQKLSEQTEQKRTPKNTLGKDDFLKLFVTQLQNQDPLNPDDGAEMAAKLAQFNSLEEMMNMNTTLGKMVDGQNSQRSLQLVNYIGKELTIDGGKFQLDQGKFREASFDLKAPSVKTILTIRDAQGKAVAEKDLGGRATGSHKIEWDGKLADGALAPNGVYSYSLTAKDSGGADLPVSTKTRVKITGVDLKDAEGVLLTELGRIKLGDVNAIDNPGAAATATAPVVPAAAVPSAVAPSAATPAAAAAAPPISAARKEPPAIAPAAAPALPIGAPTRAPPPASAAARKPPGAGRT